MANGRTIQKLYKEMADSLTKAKTQPKGKRKVDAEDVNFRDMSTKEYNARTKAQDSKTGRKIAAGVGGATAVAVGASMMGGEDKKSSASAKAGPERISKQEFLRMEKEDTAKQKAKKAGGTAFEKAFKEARAAGIKTFDFGGKKFTTRYAEEDNDAFLKSLNRIKEKNKAALDKKIEEVNKLYKGGMPKAKKAKKK